MFNIFVASGHQQELLNMMRSGPAQEAEQCIPTEKSADTTLPVATTAPLTAVPQATSSQPGLTDSVTSAAQSPPP